MSATRPARQKNLLRVFFGCLKLALAVYFGALTGLYFCQTTLQYLPVRTAAGTPQERGVPEMSVVSVKTEDGLDLLAWFAPPKAKGGKIIVFFHGNGSNLAPKAKKAREFLDRGYGFYLCEYRGFGGNPGDLSEEGLYRDARAGLKWLAGQGYSAAQIVLYGESLGTGVAVQMAMETQPEALVLEGAFSSAADIAKHRYPVFPIDLVMKDRFDSIDKIGKVKSALLMLHGDLDNTIPPRYGRKLFEAAQEPKEFIALAKAGHNDLYQHGAGGLIADWLEKQAQKQ